MLRQGLKRKLLITLVAIALAFLILLGVTIYIMALNGVSVSMLLPNGHSGSVSARPIRSFQEVEQRADALARPNGTNETDGTGGRISAASIGESDMAISWRRSAWFLFDQKMPDIMSS